MFQSGVIKISGKDKVCKNAVRHMVLDILSTKHFSLKVLPEIYIFTGYEIFELIYFLRHIKSGTSVIVIGAENYRCLFSRVPSLNHISFISARLPLSEFAQRLEREIFSRQQAVCGSPANVTPFKSGLHKRIIELLLSGLTLNQISSICKVDYRTVSRFKCDVMRALDVKSLPFLMVKIGLYGKESPLNIHVRTHHENKLPTYNLVSSA